MSEYKDETKPSRVPKVLLILAVVLISAFAVMQLKFGYPDRPDAAELVAGATVYELNLTPL